MADRELVYEDIVLAAEKVLAGGKKPTVARVQQLIEQDSDPVLIEKFLEKWRTEELESEQAQELKKQDVDRIAFEILEQYGKISDEVKSSPIETALSLVRSTLEATADGILMISKDGRVIDWNQKFAQMWRMPESYLKGVEEQKSFQYALEQVEDPDAMLATVTRLYDNPEEDGELGELPLRDGRTFERYSQPHRVGSEIVGRVYSFRDITEKKRVEQILRLRERAIESSTNGVLITDLTQEGHPIVYANPAFEKITGYDRNEVIGQNCRFLQGEDTDQPALRKIGLAINEGREESVIIRNYRKNGDLFWNELRLAPVKEPDGSVKHYVGVMQDITERKDMEQQLLHQATHDALTGLPNRSLLLDRIEQGIIQSKRQGSSMAVLFLDLDQFKRVNDSLGHDIGDRLLNKVSNRLKNTVRESDTVARLGGDEFILLLNMIDKNVDISRLTQQLLDEVAQPYEIGSNKLNLTASVGICFYPNDGEQAQVLLKNADISMYQAKELGRNNFQFYNSQMSSKVTRHSQLENDLHVALDNNEFELLYQPIYHVPDRKIVAVESLIRWNHAKLGLISPFEFIPLAEDTGLIGPIGQWVLDTACAQGQEWVKAKMPIRVSVNISGRQFVNADVVEVVRQSLDKTGLDPALLELELTESFFLHNIDTFDDKLQQLNKLGISIAIDDFGTGYSSFSYLKRLPVDHLKVDRAFVKDLENDASDRSITKAIISLAHSLDINVIAEGVETKDQLEFLEGNACDEIQGYYFSKPINITAFNELLRKDH